MATVSTSVNDITNMLAAMDSRRLVATEASPMHKALATIPLRRALDGAEVLLPTLWNDDEKVVVVFLRHFG